MKKEELVYILENFDKSKTIYESLYSFSEELLKYFDSQIANTIKDILGKEFIISDECSLSEDHELHLANKSWLVPFSDNSESLCSFYIDLDGEEPIWSFLGSSFLDEKCKASIGFTWGTLIAKSTNADELRTILKDSAKDFEELGFIIPKTKHANHIYRELNFSSDQVLNAIKEDNWDNIINHIEQEFKLIVNNKSFFTLLNEHVNKLMISL